MESVLVEWVEGSYWPNRQAKMVNVSQAPFQLFCNSIDTKALQRKRGWESGI